MGFTSIDSTYSFDSMTQLILFFAALFLTVVCYSEYYHVTDMKVSLAPLASSPLLLLASLLTFPLLLNSPPPPPTRQVFTYYHYGISAAALNWQLSGNASTIGIIFLSAPHLFTLWGTLALFAKDKIPAAMV